VVTPEPSVWRHTEDPKKAQEDFDREGIRRVLTGHHWHCLAPDVLTCWNQGLGWFAGGICRKIARRLRLDNEIGWIKPATNACASLTATDVDVILATATPVSSFRLARSLSARLQRPFVLDYRDSWTANPHTIEPAHPRTIREESGLLRDCSAVTVVSPSIGADLQARYHLDSKLHVLTNGYDPEEIVAVKPAKFSHFAIVYTGSFYPPKRPATPIMAALSILKERLTDDAWYFHYYGAQENYVRQQAQRFGVLENVVLHGMVRRSQALAAVRGADVAIVVTSVEQEVSLEDNGILTGKVFEALGLGTPILLIAPSGSDVAAIVESSRGGRRYSGTDIAGIARFITTVAQNGCKERRNIDAYSWKTISSKLDIVLRGLLPSSRDVCRASSPLSNKEVANQERMELEATE
jgi:glycosyltransferase involved in cell wall biosynthesis